MTKYRTFHQGTQSLEGNHPIISLIVLLALVLAGGIVFGILAVLVGMITVDGSLSASNINDLLSGESSNTGFIKVVQAISSVGMFIVPALLFSIIERRQYRYLNFKASVNPQLWFIVIAIMFFSAPIFEQAIKLNEQMKFPEAFADLENWMKAKETELERLTNRMLSDTQYGGLLINLIVVAAIPAIGEEFIFRGCVQGVLTRWVKNPHVAIWITAVIFSAIHLQFYGFLPRMLLGALFGYLLFWGKNIWLPILAHFLNNAAATISAFYLLRQGKSLDEMDFGDKIPDYLYFFSFVVSAVLLFQYYRTTTGSNTRYHGKALD